MAFNEARLAMFGADGFLIMGEFGFAFRRGHNSSIGRTQRLGLGRCISLGRRIGLWRGQEGDGVAIGRERAIRSGCVLGSRRHGLGLLGPSQFVGELVEAVGKTLDIEIQRIVVAVANVGVECGVKSGNEPLAGTYAGDRIEERNAIVLRRRKGRIGRAPIACATAR